MSRRHDARPAGAATPPHNADIVHFVPLPVAARAPSPFTATRIWKYCAIFAVSLPSNHSINWPWVCCCSGLLWSHTLPIITLSKSFDDSMVSNERHFFINLQIVHLTPYHFKIRLLYILVSIFFIVLRIVHLTQYHSKITYFLFSSRLPKV